VTFEPDSQLDRIEVSVFCDCSSLKSLFLPASLTFLAGSAFSKTAISLIAIEDGNSHFRVSGSFVTDLEGISLI
jgi:hypothetical protein